MPIQSPFDVGSDELIEAIGAARCILFITEHALSLVDWFQNTHAYQQVVKAYQSGAAIAAWGAAAAALSVRVVRQSHGALVEDLFDSSCSRGLGLISALLMEIGLPSQQNLRALLASAINLPQVASIGIGRDTGVIIRQGRYLEVIGHEEVVVLNAANLCAIPVDGEHSMDRLMQLSDIDVQLLIEGDRYDLTTRTRIQPAWCGV